MSEKEDIRFMQLALNEAFAASEKGEIPVGAVVVWNNRIIGKGYNLTQTLNDVTAHAEMQAITAAANHIGGKYLDECTLYVTLEPCVMCDGAMFWAQLGRLVYGASDEKRGFTKVKQELLHPSTVVDKGILQDKCSEILTKFFKEIRK